MHITLLRLSCILWVFFFLLSTQGCHTLHLKKAEDIVLSNTHTGGNSFLSSFETYHLNMKLNYFRSSGNILKNRTVTHLDSLIFNPYPRT